MTLQSDPAKYAAYVQEKSERIMSEVVDSKRSAFVKTAGDMARMMDMDHNSLVALNRTNDLMSMQDYVLREQESETSAIRSNKDNTRRQVEINNWYYENKRESLFVLQLILLVMLTITIILVAAAYEWIGKDGADYLMLFVLIVGLGTWLYRWYYTTYIRDARYWSRRNFPQDGKIAPPSGQICIGSDGDTQPVNLSS
jgi:hypothetical protein